MRALSLFSGIGGLDLAAEAAGIKIAAMCEIEPFCRTILSKRWPGVPLIEDVRTIHGGDYVGTIDIIFGGFPCQDLSMAGRRQGLSGARSGLWFEMARLVQEIRPAWVLAENVRGAVELALDTVVGDLAAAGYEVRPVVLSASAFGAPHRRERLFVVAARQDVADGCKERLHGRSVGETWGENAESRDELIAGRGGGLWPTPTVCGNYNRRGVSKSSGDGLATAVSANNGDVQGQLNPDWLEELMGFPEGWTNPDIDEPEPWKGWPAPMGMRLWATPNAADGQGSHGGGQGRSLRSDVREIKRGFVCDQYDYEFPRTVRGGKYRAARIKALGNAVVPQQALPLFQAIVEMGV